MRRSRILPATTVALVMVASAAVTTQATAVPAPTAAPTAVPASAPAAAAPAKRKKKLWKPNPASGNFTLTRTLEGATLTVSGSGFRGLYEAYTWPESMGWQPAKGNPAATVNLTYTASRTNSGYYDCQRSGQEVSASGSASLTMARSDYVTGFVLGGPTLKNGNLFGRKWGVASRAFQLKVTFEFPLTVRNWSEDLGSGGGCIVVEDPDNGTRTAGITIYLDGTLDADNKTVTIKSFTSTSLEGMPNAFTLDDPAASGTFTFARDLRLRR